MVSNRTPGARHEWIYERTHVAACHCFRILGLNIIAETMRIYLPPSGLFTEKEPLASMVDDHTSMELSLVISPIGIGTIKLYFQLLYPHFLILGYVRCSHYGF
jgi:hypothetical protein